MGIGGQLQHRCGVDIFAAERKAQIIDGLTVHDDVGLLALDVHHHGGLGQQQIDRHQRAGAGLGHDVAHDAGLVIQLGQERNGSVRVRTDTPDTHSRGMSRFSA